ncbi:MAG TPA: YgiQ family radical SAM protein, partial [bacterium]|nr:YgiQ family radical SAM protein [bacterium]
MRSPLPQPKFLPITAEEVRALGWDPLDVVLVSGDAYVDHPSFGAAVIGRWLVAQGYRVGILAQPDWKGPAGFRALGKPSLYFGVTAGVMDSMINKYTAQKKARSEDLYSPGGRPDMRPDRASIVYANRVREAFKDVPVILGGVEASLRRLAHFDYWDDKVRRSVLLDAKADLLVYGLAEETIVGVTRTIDEGKQAGAPWSETLAKLRAMRGTASIVSKREDAPAEAIVVAPYEKVSVDPAEYARVSRQFHLETNPLNARPLLQGHGDRFVLVQPPPLPLDEKKLDTVYELPFRRAWHPSYTEPIPALEPVKFSVTIMRGCFGGCSFCSITEHEGRAIQSRSEKSILKEIASLKDVPGFTGVVSDIGGPTANMWRMRCTLDTAEKVCRRLSCVHPKLCRHMEVVKPQDDLVQLMRKSRALPGVKRVLVASGVRYDLAVHNADYMKELVTHHVGGHLKIAPEHVSPGVLMAMKKPEPEAYDEFERMFNQASREAGKKQYLVPYFIGAHPGSKIEDMIEMALWLKRKGFRLRQVQDFQPTPMTLSSTMFHTGINPGTNEPVYVPRTMKEKKLQKAFLRYH